MTVPTEYQQANVAFYNFLTDVRDQTDFDSTHPAYTIAQGVLQAFRRRLEVKDAIRFANVLPVGLRALSLLTGIRMSRDGRLKIVRR